MKVGFKLTGIFLIFTLSITVLFYLAGLRNQNYNFKETALEHISNVKTSFHNLEERDAKILSSALEVIVQDPELKEIYLKKDRGNLYRYGRSLFRNLKNRYGITHFYFILPDGRVFLRMHDEKLYGDTVKRISFQKARDTKNPAWEIELGKTAFALRAVMPYYKGNVLIGYVELGEGIDHFLRILKGETSSEFGIIADKEYLDRSDWRYMRRTAGLRDNWDNLEKHVVIGSTSAEETAAKCFTEDNLERAERGENVFQQIQSTSQTFICGGFGLNDTVGRHIGAVLSLVDITDHVSFAQKANESILYMAIILFFVTFAGGILISRSITGPILKLADVAKAVSNGDLEQRVGIVSNDEIGQLGKTFNAMIETRKQTEEALQKSEGKYRSLVESTDDSIYLVDKDYTYLYMNKRHAARMGFSGDEYTGRAYSEFHSSEGTKEFIEKVAKVFETGEAVQHEHLSSRDNKYFLRTLSPVKDADGSIIAVTVVSKDINELKQLEEKLRTMSLTDELTGIYNRRGFFTLVEQMLKLSNRRKIGIYMLYADLDNLKEINDTWGHHEGDQALIDTASIFRTTFRDSDVIARIGGDEFVAIPVGSTGDNTEAISDRLQKNLEHHNAKSERNYKLSISFGISYYDPALPCSVDELLRLAEKLMYETKMSKRKS